MANRNLVWSDYDNLVSKGLKKLFESGWNSDLLLKCHDESFNVHKIIFGFFTDFFSDFDGVWMRIDIDKEIFKSILSFIYTVSTLFKKQLADFLMNFISGPNCDRLGQS